jgi:hypothetical protein
VQVLLAEAKAWEDARRIRSYVAAMRELDAKPAAWAKWALGVADRLGPTRREE